MKKTERVQELFDWLVDGAPGAPTPMATIAKMGPELIDAGIPLARVETFVRTLHPHIVGRSFLWTPGSDVAVMERSYAYLHSQEFLASAAAQVFATGRAVRCHIDDEEERRRFPEMAALHDEGFTDFWAGPLTFMSGSVHAITFATRRADGFDDDDVAALARVLRPLSRVGETFALLRTATNLLNTYVGHDAGERILKGQIQRGHTDIVDAVVWFSDLRGFTSLSSTLTPQAIIGVLNDLFDCQVPCIEARRGEVLKFIGDGLLAIFPTGGDEAARRARCQDALAAVDDSFKSLEALNSRRAAASLAPVRFGVALHVGEIAYGNIGGAGRLDFTCIGPAVNLAARLEGLTGKLERPVVVSAEFASCSGAPLDELGAFELKGVPGSVKAFAPRAGS